MENWQYCIEFHAAQSYRVLIFLGFLSLTASVFNGVSVNCVVKKVHPDQWGHSPITKILRTFPGYPDKAQIKHA